MLVLSSHRTSLVISASWLDLVVKVKGPPVHQKLPTTVKIPVLSEVAKQPVSMLPPAPLGFVYLLEVLLNFEEPAIPTAEHLSENVE